ncbi:MAG: hypothetical protein JWM36_4325 [Hyphomicrobiales bacterium]|nr:hypothetical protein [Hyphomicrobiales bacterium]
MLLKLSKRVSPEVLLAYAADVRWRKEVGGVLANGMALSTDRESQALITGAVTFLSNSPEGTAIQFKGPAGFVSLTRDELLPIALAVAGHVQACFAKEREVCAAISASPPTIFTHAQVDEAFA